MAQNELVATELAERGLMNDCSNLELFKNFPPNTKFYCGFDPTAPSLQLGNLIPIFTMIRLARAGFSPVVLFGGGTGPIGDPSGKSNERKLMDDETVANNLSAQRKQFTMLFERFQQKVEFMNNSDWLSKLTLIEFLRDIGKHISVNYMLAKDSVSSRIGRDEAGISYTEFSYMLLQGYDFYHLNRTYDLRMQIGGSDQWGNITAGLELIRKKGGQESVALTFPLITDSQGRKLGKTETGTIWVDPTMTSPYQLYQFILNLSDVDIEKTIKLLSFQSLSEIHQLLADHKNAPEKRLAQSSLGMELVRLLHGDDAVASVHFATEILFGGSLEGASLTQLIDVFKEVPSSTMSKSELLKMTVTDLFCTAGLCPSKSEAKRLISSSGAYINNLRIDDPASVIGAKQLLHDKILLLRSGKKKYHLVKID